MTELVIALPHGGSVTVQFNPNLVIEHPIIRCVLCVNALWVGLWKYAPLNPKAERGSLQSYPNPNPNPNPNLTLTVKHEEFF